MAATYKIEVGDSFRNLTWGANPVGKVLHIVGVYGGDLYITKECGTYDGWCLRDNFKHIPSNVWVDVFGVMHTKGANDE